MSSAARCTASASARTWSMAWLERSCMSSRSFPPALDPGGTGTRTATVPTTTSTNPALTFISVRIIAVVGAPDCGLPPRCDDSLLSDCRLSLSFRGLRTLLRATLCSGRDMVRSAASRPLVLILVVAPIAPDGAALVLRPCVERRFDGLDFLAAAAFFPRTSCSHDFSCFTKALFFVPVFGCTRTRLAEAGTDTLVHDRARRQARVTGQP